MPPRGSDKHSPRVDDEIEKETEGLLRSNRPTRIREELEAEPTVTDEGTPAPIEPEAAEEEEPPERS